MEGTLKLDTREFNKAVADAVKHSSRTMKEVVNTKAYELAVEAAFQTKVADKARIAWQLGRVISERKSKDRQARVVAAKPRRQIKSGPRKGQWVEAKSERTIKARASRIVQVFGVREDSFAARIIIARARKAGAVDFIPTGEALERAAKKLVAARAVSVGFIASGFVRAARDLRRFAKGVVFRETPKQIKVIGRKGQGIPVTNPVKMVATVVNDALVASGGKWQQDGIYNPMKIAVEGMQKAMAIVRQRIALHLAKKLNEEMARKGFRTR